MHLYYNKILLFYCLTAKKPKPCMVSAFAPFITNFKNIVLPRQHHFAFTIAIMEINNGRAKLVVPLRSLYVVRQFEQHIENLKRRNLLCPKQ